MGKMVYEKIYEKLEKLEITNLEEYQKRKSEGFMDLNIDILEDNEDYKRIALAHNYTQNGDVMADPDMEIKIHKKMKMAEALTFQQDPGLYQEVYIYKNGKTFVKPKLKKQLNKFLNQWLSNIIKQGYKPVEN